MGSFRNPKFLSSGPRLLHKVDIFLLALVKSETKSPISFHIMIIDIISSIGNALLQYKLFQNTLVLCLDHGTVTLSLF